VIFNNDCKLQVIINVNKRNLRVLMCVYVYDRSVYCIVKTNLAGGRSSPGIPFDLIFFVFSKNLCTCHVCIVTLMTVLDLCDAISGEQEAPSSASGSHVPWVFVLTDAATRGTKCGHKKDRKKTQPPQ